MARIWYEVCFMIDMGIYSYSQFTFLHHHPNLIFQERKLYSMNQSYFNLCNVTLNYTNNYLLNHAPQTFLCYISIIFLMFFTSQGNKPLNDWLTQKNICTVECIILYHVPSWTSCACVCEMVSVNESDAFLSVCDDLVIGCETGDFAEICKR